MNLEYSVNIGPNDFRTQVMSVEELISRFDVSDAISSVPEIRRPTLAQSSRIIESVLLGMPQPILYVDNSNSDWVVIEGAEYLYAYYSFCRNHIKLTSLYFKKQQYEGRSFFELSPLARSNMLNAKIIVHLLNPGLSPHERFGVYMCLKSRIDSSSLRWCRSKIFPLEYKWIKDVAKELKPSQNRTDSMQSVICYMLVGRYYRSFLKGGERNHIDAVANRLMQQVYYDGRVSVISHGFRRVLKAYFDQIKFVSTPKTDGLCLSVLYNLYRKEYDLEDIKMDEVYRTTRRKILLWRDDSAEKFCEILDDILNIFE